MGMCSTRFHTIFSKFFLLEGWTSISMSVHVFVGEIIFAIIIATLGLVLFALLIGNMQVSPPSDVSQTILPYAVIENLSIKIVLEKID